MRDHLSCVLGATYMVLTRPELQGGEPRAAYRIVVHHAERPTQPASRHKDGSVRAQPEGHGAAEHGRRGLAPQECADSKVVKDVVPEVFGEVGQ